MPGLLEILRLAWALLAAALLGRWFLSELAVARTRRYPWYRPYLSIPGILILLAILLPVGIWLIRRP
jgi:hypothetical protein